MTRYFDWLLRKIRRGGNYFRLLQFLFNEEYTWVSMIITDEDRETDALDLRFQYEAETGSSIDIFDKPCSVLEMMIALSIRADNDIYGIPGDPCPERLFWDMLRNAGLLIYDDLHFDEDAVSYIIDNILSRNYRKDGFGGFFPISNAVGADLRLVSIWNQMCYFVNENY